MRRVLTFDETLSNMRRDEAKASRVKATLDRPATAFQQSAFNPAIVQALAADIQQGNSLHQTLQSAQQATQAATGLPHTAAAAAAQAHAVTPTAAPAAPTPAPTAAPATSAVQTPVPADSPPAPKAKAKPSSAPPKPSSAPKASSRKFQLRVAAKTKLAQATLKGTIPVKLRRSSGLGSLQMVADIVPMQNVTDMRGTQLTARGKRGTEASTGSSTQYEGSSKKVRPSVAPTQAAQQLLGNIYARASNV